MNVCVIIKAKQAWIAASRVKVNKDAPNLVAYLVFNSGGQVEEWSETSVC